MRILIGCEFSGVVREAFCQRGHDCWSCDLQPTAIPGNHIQADVLTILNDGWDMAIFHPPCTYLTVAANAWLKRPGRVEAMLEAVEFVKALWDAPIPRIAIENPVGRLSTLWMKPSQIIQPYQFGDTEKKKTCLWLKRLPPLFHTHVMAERNESIWRMGKSPERSNLRSITFPGIAGAMAEQWGLVPTLARI